MIETPEYINMLNERSRKSVKAPLLSWDIFMCGHHDKLQQLDDLQRLNEFTMNAKWKHCFDFTERLIRQQQVVIITDLSFHIVFASYNICDIKGYMPEEMLGKHANMFHGPATCPDKKSTIRNAVAQQQPFDITLVNYKKDGTRYRCRINAFPVFNRSNELINFIAFEHALEQI
jgi:PAS domain S-box-containing protein